MTPQPERGTRAASDSHPGEGALIDFLARLACAASVAAVFVAAGAPGASAETLIVDNGVVDCPNAPFPSVKDAVDDANLTPEADTIAVCPGVYLESGIAITESVTLIGAGADLVRIEPTSTGGYIVDAAVPGAGQVSISGVTLAAGDPDDGRPLQPVDGAVRFDDSNGTLGNSRITDLAGEAAPGGPVGVLAESGLGSDTAVTVQGSVVEAYGPTGILIRSTGGDVTSTVSGNVIRGLGPQTGDQDGIFVSNPLPVASGSGAEAHVVGNLIADNTRHEDQRLAAGVRFRNAHPDSNVEHNDIQGNGFGVFAEGDTRGCESPLTPTVNAPDNWWGNSAGPSVEPRNCPLPATPPPTPTGGDRIGESVVAPTPRTEPHGAPIAPGQQPDIAPAITSLSPADGTEAQPGSTVTVTAKVTEDFDVKRVEFRRGTGPVVTDTTPTPSTPAPSYSAAIPAPAAGASQAITVTAFDSADQTDVQAISLRGKVPPPPAPTPQQPAAPQQPAEPEDRPPAVAITGPAEGTAIDPVGAPRITADATDDRGVARVAFLDDGKVVCTDDAAP